MGGVLHEIVAIDEGNDLNSRRQYVIVQLLYLGVERYERGFGVGAFPHIVAGSVESFLLLANGQLGLGHVLGAFTLPVLLGNIVGGTVLFALLSYAQVMKEI